MKQMKKFGFTCKILDGFRFTVVIVFFSSKSSTISMILFRILLFPEENQQPNLGGPFCETSCVFFFFFDWSGRQANPEKGGPMGTKKTGVLGCRVGGQGWCWVVGFGLVVCSVYGRVGLGRVVGFCVLFFGVGCCVGCWVEWCVGVSGVGVVSWVACWVVSVFEFLRRPLHEAWRKRYRFSRKDANRSNFIVPRHGSWFSHIWCSDVMSEKRWSFYLWEKYFRANQHRLSFHGGFHCNFVFSIMWFDAYWVLTNTTRSHSVFIDRLWIGCVSWWIQLCSEVLHHTMCQYLLLVSVLLYDWESILLGYNGPSLVDLFRLCICASVFFRDQNVCMRIQLNVLL